MVRASIIFAAGALLAVPAWCARKKLEPSENEQFGTDARANLGNKGAKNFFFRTPGTPCFNDPKGKNPCAKGLQYQPVDTHEDCTAALKKLTDDDDPTFQVRHVPDYSSLKKYKLDSIGNKRGCIVRDATKGSDRKVLAWVEKDGGEYYGSDVCACLPIPKPEKPLTRAELSEKLSARLKELTEEMQAKVKNDRFQGAIVTVDGEKAEVVGEDDDNKVIVMKTSAPEELESRELDELVVEEDGEVEMTSSQKAALVVEQVATMCSCYPKGNLNSGRTQCCLFARVPEIRYDNRKEEAFFYPSTTDLKPHSCKDDDLANVQIDCVTQCREAAAPTDRSGCYVTLSDGKRVAIPES